MKRDKSDPAFPSDEGFPGLSMRNYVAIKAMQGMLAHSTRYKPREGSSANWHEAISEEAFQIADAMIATSSKP